MKMIVLIRSNIRKQKGNFFGIFLLMFIIAFCLGGALIFWNNSQNYVTEEMERTNFGDVISWTAGVEDIEKLQQEIEAIRDTDHVETQEILYLQSSLNGKKSSTDVEACVQDTKRYDYHIFEGTSTEYDSEPETLEPGEIYVPISFCSIYEAKIGDTFWVIGASGEKKKGYTIKGFFEDPAEGSSMVGLKNILMTRQDFEELKEMATGKEIVTGHRIHVFWSLDSTLSAKEFQQKINEETDLNQYVVASYLKDSFVEFMLVLQNIYIGFLVSFSLILLLVALIIVGHSISSSMEQDYQNIGILKALGYGKRELRRVYCLQNMIFLGAGVLLGVSLSPLLVQAVNHMTLSVTGIVIPTTMPVGLELLCFGVILAVMLLFIFGKTRVIGTISPIEAIRGGKKDVYFGSRIQTEIHGRALSFWLALRQLTAGKKQYAGACMITALLVFFLSFAGRIQSWVGPDGEGILVETEVLSVDGKTSDIAVSCSKEELWCEVEEKIKEYSPVFASYEERSESAQLNHMDYWVCATSNPEYFQMLQGRYCKYENEIVITETVKKEMGLKIGDTVTVSLGENEAEYLITGIYQNASDMGANFGIGKEGYERVGGADTAFYRTYILEDDSKVAALCKELKETFGNDVIISEKDWSGVDGIVTASRALGYLMYGISIIFIFVVVALTGSKILFQEKHDLGIYKSLGFSSGRLRIAFAFRFGIISVVGSLLGIVLSVFGTDPLVGKMLSIFGINRFSSHLGFWEMLKPLLIVVGIFFLFAYLVAGKVKKTDPGILIVE